MAGFGWAKLKELGWVGQWPPREVQPWSAGRCHGFRFAMTCVPRVLLSTLGKVPEFLSQLRAQLNLHNHHYIYLDSALRGSAVALGMQAAVVWLDHCSW